MDKFSNPLTKDIRLSKFILVLLQFEYECLYSLTEKLNSLLTYWIKQEGLSQEKLNKFSSNV